MPDFETFVIAVYEIVDAFDRTVLDPIPPRRGRRPALCRPEVVTLALVGQLARFPSERAFVRYAEAHLRGLFPALPHRSQLNRAIRAHRGALERVARACARRLGALTAEYEALDSTAIPLRSAKRRGAGALPEVTAVGRSLRLGWFAGVKLLLAVTPEGVLTGWGVGPGNAHDVALAETFFAQRATPAQALPTVGRPASGVYLADAAFAGRHVRSRWVAEHDAHVYAPPQPGTADRWPRALRRWHASARQIVETVIQRLLQGLRLERDRPRTLDGLLTRVAAKAALHNVLIAWNRAAGRPDLALDSAVGW